jgi:hypothetical protein
VRFVRLELGRLWKVRGVLILGEKKAILKFVNAACLTHTSFFLKIERINIILNLLCAYYLTHTWFFLKVPPTREVLASLPNVFSALCLNTRGLEAFVACRPFDRLFKVLLSPDYLPAMRRRRSADHFGKIFSYFTTISAIRVCNNDIWQRGLNRGSLEQIMCAYVCVCVRALLFVHDWKTHFQCMQYFGQ